MSAIETKARRSVSRQRPSRSGSLSLRPAVNSEMMTATSATRSTRRDSSRGSSLRMPMAAGPKATPTAK